MDSLRERNCNAQDFRQLYCHIIQGRDTRKSAAAGQRSNGERRIFAENTESYVPIWLNGDDLNPSSGRAWSHSFHSSPRILN